MTYKESPGILQNIGFTLEEALQQNGLSYQKVSYKRFEVDFYKEDGYMPKLALVPLK